MMKTFTECYDELLSDPEKWKYYRDSDPKIEGIYTDGVKAKSFIRRYFGVGGKGDVVKRDLEHLDYMRSKHSVSIFLLGLLLQDGLQITEYDDAQRKLFIWQWFLTTLYHDLGYVYEEGNRNSPIDSLDFDLLAENNLKTKFDVNTIENYQKYRKDICGKDDHGIVGGLLLYDRLCNNIDAKFRLCIEPNKSKERFVYNNLNYGTYQYEHFQKFATSIVEHNMFFCTEADDQLKRKVYKAADLEELVIGHGYKGKKHRFSDNPAFFLLCLADNLDPLKAYREEDSGLVLDNVYLELIDDNIIRIEVGKDLSCTEYFKSIKGLETWMEVVVDVDDNSSRSITVKFNRTKDICN